MAIRFRVSLVTTTSIHLRIFSTPIISIPR